MAKLVFFVSSWPRKIDPVPELRIEGPLAACSACQSAPVIRVADTRASRWDGSQASTPPIELTVRVRAALRRREEPQPFVVGALAIDHGRPRATVDGAPVELTATEYELLRVLSLDAGRVVNFKTLQRPVWPKRENAGANLREQQRREQADRDAGVGEARRRRERPATRRYARPPGEARTDFTGPAGTWPLR